MDIKDIKNKLTIAEVIKHYGLKADKQNRLKCPFHNNKTPTYSCTTKPRQLFAFPPPAPHTAKPLMFLISASDE